MTLGRLCSEEPLGEFQGQEDWAESFEAGRGLSQQEVQVWRGSCPLGEGLLGATEDQRRVWGAGFLLVEELLAAGVLQGLWVQNADQG